MSNHAKQKPAYDPARQWGLKPEPSRSQGDGATYVVSGHVVSGGSDSRNIFVSESYGRDAQAKAARMSSTKDADRALERLLRKDKEGMKTLAAARAFVKQPIAPKKQNDSAEHGQAKKRKRRADDTPEASESSGDESADGNSSRKNAYSAQLIRNLGFDPTAKEGRKAVDLNVQKKVRFLSRVRCTLEGLLIHSLASWSLLQHHTHLVLGIWIWVLALARSRHLSVLLPPAPVLNLSTNRSVSLILMTTSRRTTRRSLRLANLSGARRTRW